MDLLLNRASHVCDLRKYFLVSVVVLRRVAVVLVQLHMRLRVLSQSAKQ